MFHILDAHREQIVERKRNKASWTDIAAEYNVSSKTLSRWRSERDIDNDVSLQWTDEEIVEYMRPIWSENVNIGWRMSVGALRAQGVECSKERMQRLLREVDPDGVEIRTRKAVHRVHYHVEGPNALWHVDSYLKLSMYKLVVHAAIDGWSRRVFYCALRDNNRKDTALRLMVDAAAAHGYPSFIRGDMGSENFGIAEWIVAVRGANRNSFKIGSSIHNVRVERLWRDVGERCLAPWKAALDAMAANGTIDTGNDRDLYSVHICLKQVLTQRLAAFVAAHNHHPISSEHDNTPLQMWAQPNAVWPEAPPAEAVAAGEATAAHIYAAYEGNPQAAVIAPEAIVGMQVQPINLPLTPQQVQMLDEQVQPIIADITPTSLPLVYEQVSQLLAPLWPIE